MVIVYGMFVQGHLVSCRIDVINKGPIVNIEASEKSEIKLESVSSEQVTKFYGFQK